MDGIKCSGSTGRNSPWIVLFFTPRSHGIALIRAGRNCRSLTNFSAAPDSGDPIARLPQSCDARARGAAKRESARRAQIARDSPRPHPADTGSLPSRRKTPPSSPYRRKFPKAFTCSSRAPLARVEERHRIVQLPLVSRFRQIRQRPKASSGSASTSRCATGFFQKVKERVY